MTQVQTREFTVLLRYPVRDRLLGRFQYGLLHFGHRFGSAGIHGTHGWLFLR